MKKESEYTRTRHDRSPCPECGDRGPHDDNGGRTYDLTFMCTKCKHQFDAIIEIDPRRR